MRAISTYIFLIFSCLGFGFCNNANSASQTSEPTQLSYRIIAEAPHAEDSYTQGLQIVDGELWEGTGLYGQSRLMQVDRATGKAIRTIASLPEKYFGEGLTILGDTIFWITWQEETLFMYNKKSGEQIGTKEYKGEGWGLTSDGNRLFMSDGSDKIFVRDSKTFEILEQHQITLNGKSINFINEMEWIEGKIWANIYTTDFIVIINPKTWKVESLLNLGGLLPQSERGAHTDVLNGIAYDEKTKKIYVTGKNWSKIYEIEVIKK